MMAAKCFQLSLGDKQMVILACFNGTCKSTNAAARFLWLSVHTRSIGSYILTLYERTNSEYSCCCFVMILHCKLYVQAVKKT